MDRRIGILSRAGRNRCAVYSPDSTGGRNTGGICYTCFLVVRRPESDHRVTFHRSARPWHCCNSSHRQSHAQPAQLSHPSRCVRDRVHGIGGCRTRGGEACGATSHAALRATTIARPLSARNARPTMAPRSVERRMSQIVGSSGVALSASSRSGFGRRLPARPTARAVPHSRNKGSHSQACPIIPGRS
jgi:hypothetical protein